jgi:hypothetical protein
LLLWVGAVAQLVEDLLSKNKALSSNPGTAKRKRMPFFGDVRKIA